jgi:alpha-amylase
MQWSDGSHAGFSTSTPWNGLGGNYQTNNVEEMAADPNSLLNHYRKLIRIRNEQEALRRGQTLVPEDNEADVFSFMRVLADEAILVVANTNTSSLNPVLSLDFSSLNAGDYFITELLSQQALGKITIDANGGFSVWPSDINALGGRSAWILLLSIANPITATAEVKKAEPLKLMPNPASGSFEITGGENIDQKAHVQVFNSAGSLFFQGMLEGNKMTIRTQDWPAGLYMVKVSGENGMETKRVMVTVDR